MQHRFLYFFAATAGMLLWHCARVGQPQGGPKDTTPPRLDTLRSTPNYQVNFNARSLELYFDEWLKLSDPANQILISPPLVKRPTVTLRGKQVSIEWADKEVLRPNSTYTVQFGTAIKDFHEDNPTKDLKYVFSTGSFIDTLSMAGRLQNSLTSDPVADMSIALYDNLQDSIIRKEKPYYITKTNAEGQFRFSNLKPGSFKLAAFEDKDQNQLWSGEGEQLAFSDSAIAIAPGKSPVANLRVFKNQPRMRVLERRTNRYGQIRLSYSVTPDFPVAITAVEPVEGLTWKSERIQDSIAIWYDLPESVKEFSLLVNGDTVAVKTPDRAAFLNTRKANYADAVPSAPKRGQKPTPQAAPASRTQNVAAGQPAVLLFDAPIVSADTSKWILTVDSTRIQAFSVSNDSSNSARRALKLAATWNGDRQHQLLLLPGAVSDIWGKTNEDTLRRSFNVIASKSLATLNLSIPGLKAGQQYVLQLLNGQALEAERVFIATGNDDRQIFRNMNATIYTARLITDTRPNGRWDTGSYFEHRQPEEVISYKLETLRSNWELEATFNVDTDQGKTRKKQ
ncbi:MAG: Ig-like domain-containing protein [Saprospiraceae bacterium]|nr:Ig-like domain-containing protein [Saprospiraceae bacterium]